MAEEIAQNLALASERTSIVPQGISGQKASIYEFAQCLQTVGGAGVKVGQL